MSIKDLRPALFGFLVADNAVATATEGSNGRYRIFPALLPQGVRQPSLVYSRISGTGDYHMQGPSGLMQTRMQIDAWAESADAAVALANLVKARIDGYRGPMQSLASPPEIVRVQGVFLDAEREDFDAGQAGRGGMHRMSRDYMIWYEER